MLISTRLSIGLGVAVVSMLLITGVSTYMDRVVDDTRSALAASERIARGVAELQVATYDFLLNQTQRARDQWLQRHDSFFELIAKVEADRSLSKTELEDIRNALRIDQDFFATFSRGLTRPTTDYDLGSGNANRLRVNQLLISVHATASEASRLAELYGDRLRNTHTTANSVVRATTIVATLAMLLVLYWSKRSVAGPLRKLRDGADIIGRGDLDFRTNIETTDEVGELSQALDRMTARLKDTLTSRDELEAEVSERKRAEQAVRASETRFRGTFEQASVGIAHVASTGKWLRVNQRLCDILGIPRNELLTLTYQEVSHPDDLGGDRALWQNIFKGVVSEHSVEKQLRHADGSYVWVNQNLSVTADSEGGELYLIIVIEDIELRRDLQMERDAVTADLLRSNRELQQFAYVASHDLQEPLRMVSSFVQLLQRRYQGQLDKDADEYIAFAVDGAERLQRLIKDLLQFSRVESRAEPFAETDSSSVVDRALLNLKFQIEESGAEIEVDALPRITVDAMQVERLFQNLIGNALKFKSSDSPKIRIGAQRTHEFDGILPTGGELPGWVFSVSDNGIGIPDKYADRIFQIFQRLQASDAYSGTGIGLAICQRIVERHGGVIWLGRKSDRGATFYFTIPDAKVPLRRRQEAAVLA